MVEPSSDPADDQVASAGTEFPCDSCGADMTWDPDEDSLACEYCGNKQAVQRVEREIVEYTLESAGAAARGLGLEVRVAACSNCGAEVAFDELDTARACVFCGSSNVLAQEANRNSLRPESLVPIDVGRETVERNYRRWHERLWFRPEEIKQKRFRAVGVYVPHWTFDCRVHSDWSANAGYYYYVPETYVVMVNGKPQVRTRMVQKIRWVPAWGERDDAYDDVLVNASRGMPDDLARELGDFSLAALVPYRPEYLAGWSAEEYQLDLEQGWEAAAARVAESQRARCAADVPGDTQSGLRVSNHFGNVRWKHVLLPVWILTYTYRKKPYTVLIHGQTGKVVGEAPYSWKKILLAVFVLVLVGLAVLGVVALGGL